MLKVNMKLLCPFLKKMGHIALHMLVDHIFLKTVRIIYAIRTVLWINIAFSDISFSIIIDWVYYDVFGVNLQLFLEQTKLLYAEFKYLIIFSIWIKSTLLNKNENNSWPN